MDLSDAVVHGAAQLEASDGVLRECVEFTTSALFHLKFSQSLYQSVSQSVCHSVSQSFGGMMRRSSSLLLGCWEKRGDLVAEVEVTLTVCEGASRLSTNGESKLP